MGNIVGEPFRDYLKQQISLRQEIHGKGVDQNRTPQELTYLNSRTSWVKLASSTSISSSRLDLIPELKGSGLTGTSLAQQYVLFNGTNQLIGETSLQYTGGSPFSGLEEVTNFQQQPKAGILGSSPNPAYGITGNTDFGLVPMPGIESVTIKTLERGSIKRASLTIKAHNRLQFDIIDMLYLRLGYTIMLEWGDSHYLDNNNQSDPISKMGNTLIENFWFKEKPDTTNAFEILQKIENEREKYSANYDALFGRVVNFKWTFNPDASYTINLDILSIGDVIESLKVNIPVHTFYNVKGEQDPEDENIIIANKYKSTLGYLLNQVRRGFDPLNTETIADEIDEGGLFTSNQQKTSFSLVLGYLAGQIEKNKSYKGNEITISNTLEDNHPKEIIGETIPYEYISDFKLFPIYDLQNTNDEPGTIKWNKANVGPPSKSDIFAKFPQTIRVDDPNSPQTQLKKAQDKYKADMMKPPVDYIRTSFMPTQFSYYIRFGALLTVIEEIVLTYHNNDKTQPSVKFNNRVIDNLMYFVPNMVSIDPKVCFISNDQFKQTDILGSRYYNTANIAPEISPFVYRYGDNSYGMIMNIYLNFAFVLEQLGKVDKDDNVYLGDFLKNICNGLNSSLGSVNNLFPKVDPKTNEIYIYDESSLPEKSKLPDSVFKKSPLPKETGRFNLYGYSIGGKGKTPKNSSNFIHKVGITTSVTPEYATMISIGATANGEAVGESATAFSKWNIGIEDRFNSNVNTGKNSIILGEETLTPQQRLRVRYRAIRDNYYRMTSVDNKENLIYLGLTKIENTDPKFIRPSIISLYRKLTAPTDLRPFETNTLSKNYTIDPEAVSTNKPIYKAYYKHMQNLTAINKSKISGDIGFLPFKLQLDMDGISGLKIYNKIEIDPRFLPSNYSRRKDSDPNILEFIVTDVTHTIKNNQWITSIDSIASVGNLFSTNELRDIMELSLNKYLDVRPLIQDAQLQRSTTGPITSQSGVPLSKSTSTNGPNANNLRTTLNQIGYTEKGKEIDNGGDISATAEKVASAVLRKIKQIYPSYKIEITAGNDYYHQNKISYVSNHTKGRGIDFVLLPRANFIAPRSNENEKVLDNIVRILNGFSKANPEFGYIDEYRQRTKGTKGNHFHIEYPATGLAKNIARKGAQSGTVAFGDFTIKGI